MKFRQAKLNVLVVDDIPTPYRNNLYREISKTNNFDLSLLFLARKGNEKKWKLDELEGAIVFYCKCFQFYVKYIDTRFQISWGVISTLIRMRPDLIITSGYHHLGYWVCLIYSKIARKKICIWSGTTETSEQRSRNILLRFAKSLYIKNMNYGFAYGTEAKKFLIKNNLPSNKVFVIFNTSNLTPIRDVWKLHSDFANQNDVPKIIFIGRLTKLKGVQHSLRALSMLGRKDVKFRILGDGPYKNELQKLSKSLDLDSCVEFLGYMQQEQIIHHLVWADIFLFATTQEVWGIVVNEALASGLYVLSSRFAGCTTDLIIEKFTGQCIDPFDENQILLALTETISNINEIRIERESRSLWAMKFSTNKISEEFINAVDSILLKKK